MQGGGEYCMYPGEGPGFGHCEPQPLHHPPCVEQAWPHGQHYAWSHAGGPPVFKSDFCSMEVPLSHFHQQSDYFSDGKPKFSHLQWMQGGHKKGMSVRSAKLLGGHGCTNLRCLQNVIVFRVSADMKSLGKILEF